MLEIKVQKSESIPYFAQNEEGKWLVYIRKDDQNIVAPRILLKVWEQLKSLQGVHIRFSDEEKRLLSLLESNERLSLNQFTRQAKLPRWKGEKILVKLIVIGVVRMEISDTGTRFFLRDDFDAQLP